MPNFTLEGHEKGVNCVDYYSGGDRPYLISGADDRLVKVCGRGGGWVGVGVGGWMGVGGWVGKCSKSALGGWVGWGERGSCR